MIEFFNNIWSWIISNKDTILSFLTSSTFASILVTIVLMIKTIRSNNRHTLSIKSMNDAISNNNNISSDLSESKMLIENQNSEISSLRQQYADFSEDVKRFEEEVVEKLNCMLDLYSVVYSTLKDDSVRDAANSILMKARYYSDLSKEQLKKDVEDLKTKLSEKISDIKDAVNETVDSVTDAVDNTKVKHNKLKRY